MFNISEREKEFLAKSKIMKPSYGMVKEAISSIQDYQSGKKRPIKTPFSHLNDLLMGGIFPGKILVIAGQSGMGKTYILQKIEESIFNSGLNPFCEKHRLVRCSWEMTYEDLLLRRLSRELNMDIDEILAKPFQDLQSKIAFKVVNEEADERISYIPVPADARDFYNEMNGYLSIMESDIHVVVTIDHAAMTEGVGNKKMSIDDLVSACNILKKMFNVSFVIITQLNRDMDKRKDKPHLMAPEKGDIYQSDTMFQISDCTLAINRPEISGIETYMSFGEKRYDWLNKFKTSNGKSFRTEGLVFYHYIKVRNTKRRETPKRLFVEVIKGYEHLYDSREQRELSIYN